MRSLRPDDDEALGGYNDQDILFGRGGLTNAHPGNNHLRAIAGMFAPAYARANKNEKTSIALLIVDLIDHQGGRFLRKNAESGQWHKVHPISARYKVSSTLRDCVSAMRSSLGDQDPAQGPPVVVMEDKSMVVAIDDDAPPLIYEDDEITSTLVRELEPDLVSQCGFIVGEAIISLGPDSEDRIFADEDPPEGSIVMDEMSFAHLNGDDMLVSPLDNDFELCPVPEVEIAMTLTDNDEFLTVQMMPEVD